jgi:hypothetical protein
MVNSTQHLTPVILLGNDHSVYGTNCSCNSGAKWPCASYAILPRFLRGAPNFLFLVSSAVMLPLGWHMTIIPLNYSLDDALWFKIMYNGNLPPSTNTSTLLLLPSFNYLMFFINTDIATSSSTILFHGILKFTGVLLAFPVWLMILPSSVTCYW